MALSEIFFLAIVFYLLYRFVFNFLIPVARTTRQVREQFRNMQEMQEGMGRPQAQQSRPQQDGRPGKQPQQDERPGMRPVDGDYIDFEEIK